YTKDIGEYLKPLAGPDEPAANVYLAYGQSAGDHVFGDVEQCHGNTFNHSACKMRLRVVAAHAKECSARMAVPKRCAFTVEVRQEHEAIGSRPRVRDLAEHINKSFRLIGIFCQHL